MTQIYGNLPIRTKKDAYKAAPHYFPKRVQLDPRDSHTIVGPLLLTPRQTTMCVIKTATHRLAQCHVDRRVRGQTYSGLRAYYVADVITYQVAEISWGDGHVTVHAVYPLRRAADRRLLELHDSV